VQKLLLSTIDKNNSKKQKNKQTKLEQRAGAFKGNTFIHP
jgi:hypothetical protein